MHLCFASYYVFSIVLFYVYELLMNKDRPYRNASYSEQPTATLHIIIIIIIYTFV